KHYRPLTDEGLNRIYRIPVNSGTPLPVTDPQQNAFNVKWRPDGKKITYLSGENGNVQLYEAEPGGSNKVQVATRIGVVSGENYAPEMKHIAYSADIKLDLSANEVYPDLHRTKARIIDGLLYRHWDSWHDYAYSHIFIAA